MVYASELFKPIIYAEDTTLLTSIRTAKAIDKYKTESENINIELSKVTTWLQLNKLSLNCEKTKAMIFHTPQRKVEYPQPTIGNHKIEYVNQFNFLGIILDSNLNWKYHAHYISNKLSRTLGIMNKLKQFLPTKVMLHIYNSLFLAHVNYGLFLWGWKSQNMGKLVKKAVRIIAKCKYNAHTSEIFKRFNLLKFEDLCALHDYKICYKLLNALLPDYFLPTFNTVSQEQTGYATRISDKNLLKFPFIRHEYSKQSFIYRSIEIINSMKDCIKNKIYTHSFIGFKLYIKTIILSSYNVSCETPNCYVCQLT